MQSGVLADFYDITCNISTETSAINQSYIVPYWGCV